MGFYNTYQTHFEVGTPWLTFAWICPSTNKPAKDFLRSKFHTWYADKLSAQLDEKSYKGTSLQPIDLRLSIVKPLGARWMIELYNHFKLNPQIIINGFKDVGILDILKS